MKYLAYMFLIFFLTIIALHAFWIMGMISPIKTFDPVMYQTFLIACGFAGVIAVILYKKEAK